MMTKMTKSQAPTRRFVTFTGGHIVDGTVVQWMFALEAQGCTFRLEDDGRVVRLVQRCALTAVDQAFFQTHGAEARDVLRAIPPAVM
jgi:hypothetical protein